MSVANDGGSGSGAWRFVRNLLDIVLAAGFVTVGPLVLEVYLPSDVQAGKLVSFFVGPAIVMAFVWLLLRGQGDGFAAIGLGPVKSVRDTVLQGVALAMLLFAIALGVEAAGVERDLSSLRAEVENKPINLLIFVLWSFFGAGLYEEMLFRGFVLNRFARMFGAAGLAWPLAAVLQGVLFGVGHVYQRWYGVLFTGVLGTAFGFVFLLNGRNLWALVLAHGLYDAARFVFFYLMWSKF